MKVANVGNRSDVDNGPDHFSKLAHPVALARSFSMGMAKHSMDKERATGMAKEQVVVLPSP
jgi:hypothetical protein